MKVFVVERTNGISWCQYYRLVVVAKDALHAERAARWHNEDFKKSKNLRVIEIDTNKECVVAAENTGA